VKTQHRGAWLAVTLTLLAAACGEVPPEDRVEDLPNTAESKDAVSTLAAAHAAPAVVAKSDKAIGSAEENAADDQPSEEK
jgi:hypothetical protein